MIISVNIKISLRTFNLFPNNIKFIHIINLRLHINIYILKFIKFKAIKF